MVVEDSADDFETVCMAARLAGVTNPLVHALNADLALAILDAAPAGSFSFMLLDFNLPGTDGLTFLSQFRQHPAHAQLPVVVFTASVNPRDRAGFLAAGADAFYVKTVRFEQCLETLAEIFARWLPAPMSDLMAPPARVS